MKKFLVIFLLLLSGCLSVDDNSFVEGTSITLGLYIPFNGSVYGLQCFNFLSGVKGNFSSNSVHYISTSTNHIFGSSTSYRKSLEIK